MEGNDREVGPAPQRRGELYRLPRLLCAPRINEEGEPERPNLQIDIVKAGHLLNHKMFLIRDCRESVIRTLFRNARLIVLKGLLKHSPTRSFGKDAPDGHPGIPRQDAWRREPLQNRLHGCSGKKQMRGGIGHNFFNYL
jgi:hypothetical protein